MSNSYSTKLRKISSKIGSGTTPRGGEGSYVRNGIPFIRSQNVLDGRLDFSNAVFISKEQHKKMQNSELEPNDVLLNITGASIGRSCVVPNTVKEGNVNQHVCIIRLKEGNDPKFLSIFLNSSLGQKQIWSFQGGGSREGLNYQQIGSFDIPVFDLSEQVAVAELLSTWDAAIEKAERLIAAKEQRLSVLREECLQKTGESMRVKLKAVTRESIARNGKRLGRDSIMAVTKAAGMRPMKEETIASSIDRYKVVRSSAFAYNPMRLNIGSIAMSPFDADVLVSPDYVVFECDESKLLPGCLNHLRFSRHWTNYFESAGSGSVRVRIYYDDLAAFTFDLPPIDAQKRIVDVLDAAVLEIDLLKKQADAYRRQKRGLMQKLLTGAWRVRVGGGDTDEHGLTGTDTD